MWHLPSEQDKISVLGMAGPAQSCTCHDGASSLALIGDKARQRTTAWFGLERTFQRSASPEPCHGQGHLTLN